MSKRLALCQRCKYACQNSKFEHNTKETQHKRIKQIYFAPTREPTDCGDSIAGANKPFFYVVFMVFSKFLWGRSENTDVLFFFYWKNLKCFHLFAGWSTDSKVSLRSALKWLAKYKDPSCSLILNIRLSTTPHTPLWLLQAAAIGNAF